MRYTHNVVCVSNDMLHVFCYVQFGNTVLHLAAMFGFPEIIAYLITKHGMNANEKDEVCPSNLCSASLAEYA